MLSGNLQTSEDVSLHFLPTSMMSFLKRSATPFCHPKAIVRLAVTLIGDQQRQRCSEKCGNQSKLAKLH